MDEDLIEDVVEETVTELPSSNTIIDSTQNAIMGVAENVSQVFDSANTVAHEAAAAAPIYTEVRFWIGVAFILAVSLIIKPIVSFTKKALQQRVTNVINDIDEAVKLRDDAQVLLADYERKFINVEKEAQQILDRGRKNLQNLQNIETAKMKENVQNKERETQRRILTSTEKAKNEISSSVSNLSIGLAQRVINKYLANTAKSQLIDEAIADLDRFIKKA